MEEMLTIREGNLPSMKTTCLLWLLEMQGFSDSLVAIATLIIREHAKSLHSHQMSYHNGITLICSRSWFVQCRYDYKLMHSGKLGFIWLGAFIFRAKVV